MPIDKIAYNSVETPIQDKQAIKKEETKKTVETADKEKSNAAKYMIGATALAAVIGLGIAGRKGHLGEGVQRLLRGAKKSASARNINPELIKDNELRKVIEKLDSDKVANFADGNNPTLEVSKYIDEMRRNFGMTLVERFANYQSPSEFFKAADELRAKKYDIPVKALENYADNIDFEKLSEKINKTNSLTGVLTRVVVPKNVKPQKKLRIILNAVAESERESFVQLIDDRIDILTRELFSPTQETLYKETVKYLKKLIKIINDCKPKNGS